MRRAIFLVLLPLSAAAQTSPAYRTPTLEQRGEWWANASFGWQSWAGGVVGSGWNTAWNAPKEWGHGVEGFGRRLATRNASVSISNGIEASLGSVWGEDPRYTRKGRGPMRGRIGHLFKSTLLARHPDGSFHPAFARYTGIMTGDFVQNAWQPPSCNGWTNALGRFGVDLGGLLGSNAFSEFFPDAISLIKKKRRSR